MSVGLSLIIITSVYVVTSRRANDNDLLISPILNDVDTNEDEGLPLSK